jgi:hypothetical protein
MIFEFGNYKLDVDVEKTRKYYEIAKAISEECDCVNCENYANAIDFLPQEVISFFDQLGVDMRKSPEVYNVSGEGPGADNTIFYQGWYHVCGNIIYGESPWVSVKENHKYWDTAKTFSISNDFK